MSHQMNFWPTLKSTSSPDTDSGLSPSGGQELVMTSQRGPAVALASLSARQAKERGLLTSGICGPRPSTSSPMQNDATYRFMESRLRAVVSCLGSTLYGLTWKQQATPSGRSFSLLRASVLRSSGKGRSGWRQPSATDDKRGVMAKPDSKAGQHSLNTEASLSGWPAPRTVTGGAESAERKQELGRMESGGGDLQAVVLLAAWCAPSSRDWKDTEGMATLDQVSRLSGWAIPRGTDAGHSTGNPDRAFDKKSRIEDQVFLAGWPAPMAGSPATEEYNEAGNTDSGRKTQALVTEIKGPARLTVSGLMLIGCDAGMNSGGQLSPEHSRWLMGIPSVWASCGVSAMQSLRKLPRSSSKRTAKQKGK